MSGSCNIATGKNSFAINLTFPPSENLSKSPLSNTVTSVENSNREIKPLNAQAGARNTGVGEESSSRSTTAAEEQGTSSDRSTVEESPSSSSRTADLGPSSERIDERPEVTTARDAFLTRPTQENALNLLFASHSSKLSENERVRVQSQNDEQGKKTVIISDLLGLQSVSGNSWQDLLPQIKGQGNVIFAQVEEKMTADALEAWQAFHPGEAIPNPLPFRDELEMCKSQIRNSLVQLTNMPSDASNQAISGPANQIIDALTTICHTLIPRSPNQPAAANPGPDMKADPAADRGVSFGNIHNQQGDTIHNHYYGTPPGNENTSGHQSRTVISEKSTTKEQTPSTVLPPGGQLKDEQRIDSRTTTQHKENIQLNKKTNVGVNGDLARVSAPAIARKIAAVMMQDVASVPQNANRPLFSRDLERTRPPGQEVNNLAAKNDFADLKGVKNLINAWENVAIAEANGPLHHRGLPAETDSDYESTGDSRDSALDDIATVAFNSIDDVDPRNAPRRMSESSAAESGYDRHYSDDGNNSDYTSWKDPHSAGRVQHGEIGSHRDENDSIFDDAETDSVLREKMAFFNKGNGVKSESGLNPPQKVNRDLFARNLRQVLQPGQDVNNPAEKNSFADLKGVKNLINAWENVAVKGGNAPVNHNGQQVNNPAGKTSFADLKGVKNLIDAWENVAIEEANGSVQHHGLPAETDSGYESIGNRRDSVIDDIETVAFNSVESHGDVVTPNTRRRMSESSVADSGYGDGDDNKSLASINDLKHTPEVQVDETNHLSNKVTSLGVNAEKGAMVQEKMALFSKGSEVKSQSTRKNFTWEVKENDRVYTTEAKPMTIQTPDMFK